MGGPGDTDDLVTVAGSTLVAAKKGLQPEPLFIDNQGSTDFVPFNTAFNTAVDIIAGTEQ